MTPTQWFKLKTVFVYLKPLHEVTTLHLFNEHVVYNSTVASLHNQAQFHFFYVRITIFLGIRVF